ncbi:uncharacterized protein METZ01_LOCUS21304 [marine metagenome]|uniref:Uncharacterized protein n=1 Tax=marine metagenome TaxID=408172 RepID=A0A381PND1_9ZZZZ
MDTAVLLTLGLLYSRLSQVSYCTVK